MKLFKLTSSLLIIALLTVGCAGTLRHKLVVASATAHGVLAAIEDTVNLTTCDVIPSPCIDSTKRKLIAAKLVDAFALDESITKALRDWDGTTPTPTTIGPLLADLNVIVAEIIRLIPNGKQKNVLNTRLGVH